MKKRRGGSKLFWIIILMIVLLGLLCIGFFYFNSSDNKVFNDLKGSLGESSLSVSAGLRNSRPVVESWETPLESSAPPIPIENDLKPVTFNVVVSDRNGYRDLTRAGASITGKFIDLNNGAIIGEQERSTGSDCVFISSRNPREAIFQCTINMQYWDEPGTDKWTIQITATDARRASDTKSSSSVNSNYPFFSYGSLLGMATDKASISFQEFNIDTQNMPSAENPVIVRNTGNVPVTASGTSWIKVTGKNLVGQDSGEVMDVSSFAVNDFNDCTTGFDALVDNTAVQVNGVQYSRRPGDDASGLGRSSLYFCIGNQITPQSLPEDQYITSTGGEWIIEASQ
jgi:hypothetical protein